MGKPAATANHSVVGGDTHIVMVPTPGGPVPTPLPHPFSGKLDGGLINTVKIGGQAAAVSLEAVLAAETQAARTPAAEAEVVASGQTPTSA